MKTSNYIAEIATATGIPWGRTGFLHTNGLAPQSLLKLLF
jgi:hypothetical protein